MKRIAFALYAISAITVLAGAAIAPAMGDIVRYFPDVHPIYLQMIITLPSLMVIPCTVFSHRLCRRFGKRRVLVAGLLLYFVGGCGAGLADSIWTLLALRAVLGIGMGTITPVCHSLPADYFHGHDKVSVVGRMSAFLVVGAAVCSIGAGWLAIISWRASFGIYAVSLVVLLLVMLFLPAHATEKVDEDAAPPMVRLPGKVYFLGGTMVLYMAAFYAFPLGLALHLEGREIGDSRTAGYLFALISMVGFVVGLWFPRVMRAFGMWLTGALLLCMGCGYMLVAFAESSLPVWSGCSLVGIGLGGLTPLHYVTVNHSVPREATVKAMAVLVSGTFLGQFLSPFLVSLAGMVPSSLGVYGVIGTGVLLVGVAAVGIALFSRADDKDGGRSDSQRLSAVS